MAVLMVPPAESPEHAFPTLGPQVVKWMEEFLVFGPGDVRGRPYYLDDEKKGVIYRLYEVYPQGHPRAGRRRFKRAGISVRKGWAKTELGAAIAAAELHPDAPVRCDGFDAHGNPVGVGVADPYIPMVAFTEEQSEELAYGALLVMLGEGPLADDFDLGVERILVIGEDGKAAGKAVALASNPNSRDGARTTFQLFDETHRQDSDRLRHAHQTMLQNLPKRLGADAWSLEVTTSFEPGKDSIAERTHNYAKLVVAGELEEPSLFYYNRFASDRHDLTTREGRAAAVLEASGPAAAHTDVDYVVGLSFDPDTDLSYWERVWLNREVSSSGQFFPIAKAPESSPTKGYDDLALPRADAGDLWLPERGAMVTLGFDGSKTGDSTGLVVTDVEKGWQAPYGLWACPLDAQGRPEEGWHVDTDEVEAAMVEAFDRWDVVLAYCDPYFWETQVAAWVGRFGKRRIGKRQVSRVEPWATNRPRPMAFSLRAYRSAMKSAELRHSGDPRLREHIANARAFDTGLVDDHGQPLHTIRKDRRDSPRKIDLAMAGCLSWEARRDALALGVKRRNRTLHAY